MHSLSKKWVSLEVKHHTSKCATNDFWDLAKEFFPRLHRAKVDEINYKLIPKFATQRNKLTNDNVPKINLEIGYLNKETNETVVVTGEKTPVSRFNPQTFQKQYEVATVEVKLIIYESFVRTKNTKLERDEFQDICTENQNFLC